MIKSIELTLKQQYKLLEMCRTLFPEYKDKAWTKNYQNKNDIQFFPNTPESMQSYWRMVNEQIHFINKTSWDNEDEYVIDIHWFELVCTKTFLWTLWSLTDIKNRFDIEYFYNNIVWGNTPNYIVDYLYEEYKKIK